jgi:IS4 transposase
LLLWKLPKEAAAGKNVGQWEEAWPDTDGESLAWCDWNFLITNVESEKLNLEAYFLLYGVRWQIELLFKLWKTHGRLVHSRSENPQRVL